AGAARPDARQALWLSRAAGWGRAPLPTERHVACRALRARHLGLSLLRSARRAGADRRADPGAAAKSLLLRTQGSGAVGSRPVGGGDGWAAAGGGASAERGPDPDHAGAGARRHARSRAGRRGGVAVAGGGGA